MPNPLRGDVVSFLRADLEWDIHEQSSSSSAPRLVEQLEQTADALEAQQASTMKHQIEVGAIETINETQKELEQARGGDQECGLRACMVSSPWLLCGGCGPFTTKLGWTLP